MESKLFQPKGTQAIWRPLYEHLHALEYGTFVPYSKFDELLGRDSRVERGPIYSAMREMERHNHRTLQVVPREGYRIAPPEEHRTLSEKHRKRSYRQVTKARQKIRSAPRELLADDERKWLDETEIRLSQLESGLRHANRRVSKLEKKDEVKQDALARIQADLEKLREKGLLN